MADNRKDEAEGQRSSLDAPTIVAIAVVAYALANILHEVIGHGGACVLLGGAPRLVSSVHFVCGEGAMTPAGVRLLAAAGSLLNVAAALPALLWYLKGRGSVEQRYFVWLFWSINLMQAAGYAFLSGVGNIGDWALVFGGLADARVWRPILAALGGVAYWRLVQFSLGQLRPFLGPDRDVARRRMMRLAVLPYLVGGALYCVSGLLGPGGTGLMVPGAAASLGGTSGLAWMVRFLRDPQYSLAEAPAFAIARRAGWLVAALVIGLMFVGVLGPGVNLR